MLLITCVAGCILRGNKEDLVEALHRYNSGVRWGKTEWMAQYVADDDTATLLPRSEVFDGELQITGCQVGDVQFKSNDHAEAVVRVDWYQRSRGRLYTSIVQQTWKHGGSQWQIVQQRHLKGAPFPWIPRGSSRALN